MSTYQGIELGSALYQHADCLYPGFTTNGNHVNNSWHYRNGGCAVDFDSGTNAATSTALGKAGLTRWQALTGLAAHQYRSSGNLVEQFSTNHGKASGHYVKNGVRRSYAWALVRGLATFSESVDHIHVAIATEADEAQFVTRCVQVALGLTVDGVRGPKTIAKIKNVQGVQHIAKDGVPGPNTIRAIRAWNRWAPIPWTFK